MGEGVVTRTVGAAARPLEMLEEFELTLGPWPRSRGGSVFASPAERRSAWEAHRAELLDLGHAPAGCRPWAFWRYDCGRRKPLEGDAAIFYLARIGELFDRELEAIAQESADARARLGTSAEVETDRDDAALYERVTAALP